MHQHREGHGTKTPPTLVHPMYGCVTSQSPCSRTASSSRGRAEGVLQSVHPSCTLSCSRKQSWSLRYNSYNAARAFEGTIVSQRRSVPDSKGRELGAIQDNISDSTKGKLPGQRQTSGVSCSKHTDGRGSSRADGNSPSEFLPPQSERH